MYGHFRNNCTFASDTFQMNPLFISLFTKKPTSYYEIK